jgi:hypothetical protein
MSTAAAHGGDHDDSDLGLRELSSEAAAEEDDETPDTVDVSAEYRCEDDDTELYVYLKQWTDDGKAFYDATVETGDKDDELNCDGEWNEITVTLERNDDESDEDAYVENGDAKVVWELSEGDDEVTEDRKVEVTGVDEGDDDEDDKDHDKDHGDHHDGH